MPPAKKPTKRPAAKAAKPKAPANPAEPPAPRYALQPGCKVMHSERPDAGWAEILSITGSKVRLRFAADAVNGLEAEASLSLLRHSPLPNQSRIFHTAKGVVRYGRAVAMKNVAGPLRSYLVHFPGAATLTEMREDEFAVRSYLPGDDPSIVLGQLAQETPFFFQQRADLFRELLRQNQLAHALPALLSAKIEILQHQAEIADRVLHDPTIRYLLADEVGLGKTIEAAIILRQLMLDAPGVRIAVVAPDALTRQWREELDARFGLDDVEIFPHSAMAADEALIGTAWDVLVVDEAHRVVALSGAPATPLTKNARKLCHAARHLLLLSATPVLHHDADLLALLELLDPQNYSITKLAAFKERTARRVELGRAFLALRSATVPALVKMHASKLAALLPDDATVKEHATALSKPGADAKLVQNELHLHISETYRIHRRMLRTRRRWLAGGQQRFVRNVQEIVEVELDEEPHLTLWEALENWRITVVARVKENTTLRAAAATAYIHLAEAIAAEPEKLAALIKQTVQATKSTAAEEACLAELVDDQRAFEIAEARLDLLAESLRRRAAKDGAGGKYIVFCPTARLCADFAKRMKPLFPTEGVVLATASQVGPQVGELLSDFAADSLSRVLVTDATGEEGFNLQFARAVFFHDLPWSPMRLEQRLGRLDRIDRTGAIPCVLVTTSEDDTVGLDEAWRRVLAEGFGLYAASISDLQHLVDSELPRLRDYALLGGAPALLEAIPALAAAVEKERASIEEQDVIDGVHSLAAESPLTRDLAAADAAAEDFGTAFSAYLQRNLGLEERWDEESNAVRFRMKRDSDPLIPADKLDSLAAMFATRFSVHRSVVIEDLALDFLRPGHPAVDGCRELLAWDDRGRAWAMWRKVAGLATPKLVFRAVVRVSVDLAAVAKALAGSEWDAVRRGGLLRLVRGWFPEMTTELWLNETGAAAALKLTKHCQTPYQPAKDRNLGKERAGYVRAKFGEMEWAKWCEIAAKKAVASVMKSSELQAARERAEHTSTAHFAMLRARLRAREQAGIESAPQVKAESQQEAALAQLVQEILATPIVRLDALGAYVLSDTPWWPEADL